MMTAVETYLQKGKGRLRALAADPRVRKAAKVVAHGGGGFLMSAASLGSYCQPIAMGMIAAGARWKSLAMALGSIAGYRIFWGEAGFQGIVWAILGLLTGLVMGSKQDNEPLPGSALLLPAVTAFLVSAVGLGFQIFIRDPTPVPVYLLRIGLGAASAGLFQVVLRRREPLADWIAAGVGVLALAQVAPVPWMGMGFVAGGLLAAGGAFPAAALGGMALDLARVTPVPMTAVLCLSFLARLIPLGKKWLRYAAPGAVYCLVMALCETWDPMPLLPLAAGGVLAVLVPPRPDIAQRQGLTGQAQVRLELMAGVLQETRQLLMIGESPPIDQDALLMRTKERACGGCPNRKTCRDIAIPREWLAHPPEDTTALDIPCKKPGRLLLELRRSREQLRALQADRQRQQEYREAVAQQYRFLGEYLQEQSDTLARRGQSPRPQFRVEVGLGTAGKELTNGDRCLHFAGTEGNYYILLCDGMGTGLGAAQESQTAAGLLKQMLTAGFPAEYALRSLNSLTVLRGRAGAVTVDLAQIRLDTGRVTIYKWGAAPSYVLRSSGAEKIGTAGPPPGLSVTQSRETVERLSLRRGEALILFSDGVDAHAALRREGISPQAPPGELAASLLERAGEAREDDATVAVVRLAPAAVLTS